MKKQNTIPTLSGDQKQANLFKPVSECGKTFIVSQFKGESYFWVQPLLKLLNRHEGPEVVRLLDQALSDLAMYYVQDHGGHDRSAMSLMVLRDLRNAVLSGMSEFAFDFDEHLAKELEDEARPQCSHMDVA